MVSIRRAAEAATHALAAALCPYAIPLVLPLLLEGLSSMSNDETKICLFDVLHCFTESASRQLIAALPFVVSHISAWLGSASVAVKVSSSLGVLNGSQSEIRVSSRGTGVI